MAQPRRKCRFCGQEFVLPQGKPGLIDDCYMPDCIRDRQDEAEDEVSSSLGRLNYEVLREMYSNRVRLTPHDEKFLKSEGVSNFNLDRLKHDLTVDRGTILIWKQMGLFADDNE